jgi:hypothetical protein
MGIPEGKTKQKLQVPEPHPISVPQDPGLLGTAAQGPVVRARWWWYFPSESLHWVHDRWRGEVVSPCCYPPVLLESRASGGGGVVHPSCVKRCDSQPGSNAKSGVQIKRKARSRRVGKYADPSGVPSSQAHSPDLNG